MRNVKERFERVIQYTFVLALLVMFMSSCGYRIVGSGVLPFNSITIKPVRNNTYEPGLEEKMHIALAGEFINQGIEVKTAGGDFDMEATITTFALGAIGAVDEAVKEQQIIMHVDLKLTGNGKITEYWQISSPIKITFQSTGTVSESVARKETAADKACREIAQEIVSRIIIDHAQ